MTDEHDDHEHQPHAFAFQIPFGPPPEVIERARMENEANSHETRQFFQSLNEFQLKKFAGLMNQVIQTDGHAGSYYIGICSAILDSKFNLCLACGKNHDKDLAEMSGAMDDAKSRHPSSKTQSETPISDAAKRQELMEEYNLYTVDGRIHCVGCGMAYASLEDRMLRRPGKEGCSGCIDKEKWG